MTIYESQLVKLRGFGYTEVEARFLYLVATHSGYFTVPQFLTFARAKSGKRNAQLVEKLFRLGHARGQRYTRRSVLYHLGSREIYDAISKAHLRNRRDHELAHIKIRLLALDYILAHPDDTYFETAGQKRAYFTERLGLNQSLFSRSDGHRGIAFADRFPLCIAYPAPDYVPVVTFTYVDAEHSTPTSPICEPTGLYFDSFLPSNSSMSRRHRVSKTKQQSCFRFSSRERAFRI